MAQRVSFFHFSNCSLAQGECKESRHYPALERSVNGYI